MFTNQFFFKDFGDLAMDADILMNTQEQNDCLDG